MPSPVTITFLGGLKDIGRNCAAIESDGKILVLDCGILFPNEDQPGVESILPDMQYLYDRVDSIVGCVLTHAHEDHIGALRHLISEVDCPMYGSAFCLGLVDRRLSEWGIKGDFVTVEVGDVEKIGPFECEFLAVTHSVPGGHITSIKTPQGNILHSSDFKLDENPVAGDLTDIERIQEISKDPGIRLLLADSTNSDQVGISESESSIQKALAETFDENEGRRILTACFSSHIHRIQQIVNVAEEAGRRVAVMGMSMRANVDLARKLGGLQMDDYLDVGEIKNLDDGDVCVITTGSQAEQGSALETASRGKNRWFKIGENDTIILSANPIPGNEARIYRMVNRFVALEAKVFFGSELGLHTTGHGKQGELKVLHEVANAEWFVPVHGEIRQLKAHLDLAVSLGMKRDRVLLAVDGDQVSMGDSGLKLKRQITTGEYIFKQGKFIGIDQEVLEQRKSLATDGVLTVVANISKHKLLEQVHVDSRGWVDVQDQNKLHAELSQVISQAVKKALKSKKDKKEILRLVRKIARQESKDITGRLPSILAHISTR